MTTTDGGHLELGDLYNGALPLPAGDVLRKMLRRCADFWQLPELAGVARVFYNPKLRSTLGRAFLNEMRIELNTRLLRENPDQLIATLVHELAHLAVQLRFGPCQPHGTEFKSFMRATGISSRATHNLATTHLKHKRTRYLYLHKCSNCGAAFVARTVRRNCYCRACGPKMEWNVIRTPDTQAHHEQLKQIVLEQ